MRFTIRKSDETRQAVVGINKKRRDVIDPAFLLLDFTTGVHFLAFGALLRAGWRVIFRAH